MSEYLLEMFGGLGCWKLKQIGCNKRTGKGVSCDDSKSGYLVTARNRHGARLRFEAGCQNKNCVWNPNARPS